MTVPEPVRRWRKASASAPDGDCVEIGRGEVGLDAIRDSKNPKIELVLNPTAVTALLRSLDR